jgi:hypothetical protein
MKKSLTIILVVIIMFGLGMWYYYKTINTSDNITDINNQDKVENYSKIEKDKDIVYIEEEYINPNNPNIKSTLPVINIDSEDVKSINNEIKSKYNERNFIDPNFSIKTINLNNYYINNNILSIIYNDCDTDVDFLSYIVYNIDVNTGKKINNEYLLDQKGYTIEQISEIAKVSALGPGDNKDLIKELSNVPSDGEYNASDLNLKFWNKYFDTDLSKEENFSDYYPMIEADKYTMNQEITMQNAMFLNKNGELCVEVEVGAPAGAGMWYGFVNIETGELFY